MLATMPMLIYKPCRSDMKGFVKFWSRQYKWIVEAAIYDDNIGLELTEGRIWDLFRWKNGGSLSKLKEKTVRQNFVKRKAELKGPPKKQKIEDLLDRFSEGGAIWRIFWLHCWQPKRFPISDQHVHRAMTFIKTGACEEIPSTNQRKVNAYCQEYLPFHAKFKSVDCRSVDKALWAFGRYLKKPDFPVRPLNGK
jgi:hypothetical protein